MALTFEENEYVIPRGKVYFDPWDTSDATTGERYIGNCPGVTINISSQKSDHYNSEGGLREKDASVLIQVDRAGTLNCDNMSLENLQLFLSGTQETVSQTSTPVSNEALTVITGRYYQLGQSTSNPAGARGISSVVVEAAASAWTAATAYAAGAIVKPTTGSGLHYYRCTVAGTSHASTEPTWPTNGSTVTDGAATWEDAGTLLMVAGTDYNTDLDLGRLQILATVGAVATPIVVDYSRPAKTWEQVKTGSTGELYGALRIVADNASGENRDFYMPKVTLQPNGDLPIIQDGTDYASMTFQLEVLKPANAEAIYMSGRPAA